MPAIDASQPAKSDHRRTRTRAAFGGVWVLWAALAAVSGAQEFGIDAPASFRAQDPGKLNEEVPRLDVSTAPTDDLATGHWVELPPLNLARQESATVVLDGVVYVIGGLIIRPGRPTTDSVESWRPGDSAWHLASPLLQAVDHPAAAVLDGEIWVLGGEQDRQPTRFVQIFNPSQGTGGQWRFGPPLPEARAAGAAAVLGGRLFYFGGIDAERIESAVPLSYTPGREAGAGEWSELEPMSLARDHLSAVTLGDAIYVTGGRQFFISRDIHESWSSHPQGWTTRSPMPTARSAAGAAALGGLLWVGGGEFPGVFSQHEVYDPGRNSWQTAPSLPLPRHGTQPVPIDGMIVWPGGGTEAGFMPTDSVDAFVPDRIFGDGFELGDASLWSSSSDSKGSE